MTPRERGFLLLTSHLGDPERRVLTTAQLRTLAQRVQYARQPLEDRALEEGDLLRLGYSREMAGRILALLEQEEVLDYHLKQAARFDCFPITRVSPGYPPLLRRRLGLDSPGCLWAKGDPALLRTPRRGPGGQPGTA